MTEPATDPFAPLDAGLPLVLLPVRLETRVRPDSDPPELLVRLYPEQVHLHTHEPGLTEAELRHGREFWRQTWRAGDDEAAARRAWRGLVEPVGAPRAAWITRQLRPRNPGDRPTGPVPPEAELPVPPEFPAPPQLGEDELPPTATDMLPDRFVILGYAEEELLFTHWGEPVPDRLRLGPDPLLPGQDDAAIGDGSMRWLVDLEEAIRLGMAVRVPVPLPQLRSLDTLLALGVKDSLDGATGAERLAGLLADHRFTEPVGLLPAGLATNNVPDDGGQPDPRVRDAHDPDHDRSFDRERRGPLFTPGDGSDGDRVAHALGIDPDPLLHLSGAGERGDEAVGRMHTALWATTWGYYLRQLVRTVPADQIAHARRVFLGDVRGRGPYPTLRIAEQPYGLLPVTSLTRWRPDEADVADQPLVALLRRLRRAWVAAATQVPRLTGSTQPDRALLELLSMQPSSVAYRTRTLLGPAYVEHLDAFIGLGLDTTWWRQQQQLADTPLAELGIDVAPWLRGGVWSPQAQSVELPPVQLGPLSPTEPPAPNYLEWIRYQGHVAVRDAPPEQLPSLLAKLLRHSALLEYGTAARRLLAAHGALPDPEETEAELVSIDPDHPTVTVWELLEMRLPEVTGERSVGEYLDALGAEPSGEPGKSAGDDEDGPAADPALADLTAFRRALAGLAAADSAQLARLLPETLDCASHRLDAWITAVAGRRLRTLRAERDRGVLLGGYGWLTGGELVDGAAGGGFIHAPSLAHATTAAVLRGGRDAHRGRDESLAIDLSSQRLREVRELLGGVAQGQSLAALLGYRLERGLHERHNGLELDQYIAPLRELAPFGDEAPVETDRPREAIAARAVVDGLKLHRRWRRSGLPYGTRGLPARGSPEQAAVEAELTHIDELVDALGDATIAEGVHHLAQGNPERTAATFNSLSHGDVPPPELEVARTARTGATLTHRCLILTTDEAPPAAWPAADSARAHAEPRLNAWAARLFGDPARVRCHAWFAGPDGEPLDPPGVSEVTLRQLGLSPLDVLYAGDGPESLGAELTQRVRQLLRGTASPEVPDEAEVRVDTGLAGPPEQVSFDALIELARSARELVGAADPLVADDLAPPGTGADATSDVDDLASRADAAVAALARVAEELAVAGPEQLPGVLLAAAGFGVRGAVPAAAAGAPEPGQVDVVRAELAGRLERVGELGADLNSVTPAPERAEHHSAEHHSRRLAAVFGAGFRVLPALRPPDADPLVSAFTAPAEPATVDWAQRLAWVRPQLAQLCRLLGLAEALDTGTELALHVAQLPLRPEDPWVGRPVPPDRRFPAGRVSLVAHAPTPPEPTVALAGLRVDQWQEDVPDEAETTGVAFNYDQPGAHAPQAILLAVPPDRAAGWSLATVTDILRETVELAQTRAVDPDTFPEVGHYLPAVCLATNVRESTVSTRFDEA